MNEFHTKSPLICNRHIRGHIRGQGLTEYIIIVALIAVASIVAVSYFGDTVQTSFRALGNELTGAAPVDMVAETSAQEAASQTAAESETTLGNYRN